MAAFQEYIADVESGSFPEAGNLVEMEEDVLAEIERELGE